MFCKKQKKIWCFVFLLLLLCSLMIPYVGSVPVYASPPDEEEEEDDVWKLWSGEVRHLVLVGDDQAAEMWEAVEEEYKTMDNNDATVGTDHRFIRMSLDDPANCIDDVSAALQEIEDDADEDPEKIGSAVIFWVSPEKLDDINDETETVTVTVEDDPGEGEETGSTHTETQTITTHYSLPHRLNTALSQGVSEWSSKYHAKTYWSSMGPGYGYDTKVYDKYADGDSYGANVEQWNNVMKESCAGAKWLDVYEPLTEMNLYWETDDGDRNSPPAGDDDEVSDAIKDAADHRSGYKKHIYIHKYTEESYQTIFHVLFNTIRNAEEMKEDEPTVSADFYDISCSLTSYVNSVVGINATKEYEEHKGPDVKTSGNAGAILGYGDPDFSFSDNFVTKLSGGSSAVSYKALNAKSGDDNKDLFDNMLIYARYGRLLEDMGFDKYGAKTSFGSARIVSGSLMLLVFILSSFGDSMMGIMVKLLRLLNPFQLLKTVPVVSSYVTGQGQMPDLPVVRSLTSVVKTTYDAFQNLSWSVMVPLFFVLLLSMLLLNKQIQQDPKARIRQIRVFVFRICFISFGVALLGGLYTMVLDKMVEATGGSHCASTQIVSASFVNFEEWAKQYRLDPIDGALFQLDVDTDTGGGEASSDTLGSLRKSALAVNKKTNVISGSMSAMGGDSILDWNEEALTTDGNKDDAIVKQCLDLLMSYTDGDYYYPSSWQSETLSVLSDTVGWDHPDSVSEHSYYMGRRKSYREEETEDEGPLAPKPKNSFLAFVDATNQTEDWMKRKPEENDQIFANEGEELAETWEPFNILTNGGNIGTLNGRYSSTHMGRNGPKINKTGALSTLSLYNYLSTRFTDSGLIIYSNRRSTNMPNKYSHYSVNMIGSGVLGFLYYANTLVVMLVASIVSVVYALSSLFQVLKKGLSVLFSIPGASLGMIRSMSKMISTTLVMCVEVVLVVFMYDIIVRLLMVLVSGLSNLLVSQKIVESGTTIIGGVLFNTQVPFVDYPYYYVINLAVTTLLLIVIFVFLCYYRRAYGRCVNYVLDWSWEKLMMPAGVSVMGWSDDVVPVLPQPGFAFSDVVYYLGIQKGYCYGKS